MPTWVLFLGAALGGGVLFLLVAAWLIRHFLRKFLAGLAGLSDSAPPVRVKAIPQPGGAPWTKPKQIQQAREFFETVGFRWVEDVEVQPIAGAYASLLVNPEGVAAVLYEHPQAGFWADLVVKWEDRGGWTVSSAPQGGELRSPPFSQKIMEKGATPARLWALFEEKRSQMPQQKRLPLTAENIKQQFEQAYADETDWRNAQGGPSEEEVRRVASNSQPNASDEQIQSTVMIQKAMANAGLLEGLQDRFRQRMTADDHLRYRLEDLLFVHDRLSHEDLQEFVERCVDDEEWEIMSLPPACQEVPPLQAFARLQEALPEPVRFEKVGELDFPLTTHIYRPPSGRIPIETFPHRRREKNDDG